MRKVLVAGVLVCCCSWLAGALERQPTSDYRARREKLAPKLQGGVALAFAPPEAEGPNAVSGYRPDDNFYYLSGWPEPGAAVLIAAARASTSDNPARPYTEILFLPERNYSQEKWTGPKLGPENPQAAQITGFERVESLDRLRAELAKLVPPRSTIYSDVPAPEETSESKTAIDWLQTANAFPVGTSYADLRPLLGTLRTVKDDGEIGLIRKAVEASVAAQKAAIRAIKAGMTERQISALLQYEWGMRGCERPAYAPIVGAGLNSTILHYSEDSATVHSGELVLMDAAGEYSLYASDLTRTVPADGRFTPRQREIYEIVLGAQRAAITAFQSGKSYLQRNQPGSLYDIAFEFLNTHGKDGHGEPLGKYFIHGLGHYVGLNVHDPDDYSVPLSPGMVFTLEPGIYIPEEKIGIRIEDDFYVDQDGKLIRLSEDLPQTPDEIERLMSSPR
jgi:Xaa-Pro aminopeptidase